MRSVFFGFLLSFSLVGFAADKCQLQQPADKVYGTTPSATYFLIALAPEKVAGSNFPLASTGKGVLPDYLFERPVLGGWFGQGRTPNEEVLLKTKPDLALVPDFRFSLGIEEQIARLKRLGITPCTLPLDDLEDFPYSFRTAGKWLAKEEKAEKMAVFFEEALEVLEQKRKLIKKPVSIFYAQGSDGLATECDGSVHASSIVMSGAENPHKCEVTSRVGMVKVNFEQVINENPDWIITQDINTFNSIVQDSKWLALRAVKNQQVFLMPDKPWKWMDRPPAFTRLLASFWIMHQVYPEVLSKIELEKFTSDFFELFFDRKLADKELAELLRPYR